MTRIQLEGFDELNAKLGEVTDRVGRSIVRSALADGAEVVRRRASQLAPRDPHSGQHLADHMAVSVSRQRGATGPALAIGPEHRFFYGHFLEFGTVKMRPQPFLRPAFDTTVDQVLDTVKRTIWLELTARGVRRETVTVTVPVQSPGATL